MNKRLALLPAAVLCAIAVEAQAESTEKFQRLTGAQIQARVSGMEITDETHWADVFAANGLSRATRWAARAAANGVCRRMSSASIAARMTAAATRYGLRGRRLSSDGRVPSCRWRAFFKGRALVDDRACIMALGRTRRKGRDTIMRKEMLAILALSTAALVCG